MNLFRGDNDGSLRTRFHNVVRVMMQLQDGQEKFCDVLIVWLLVEAKIFDVYVCLSELIYRWIDRTVLDTYLVNLAREGRLSLGCSSP
jgi:hypothetical protein